MKIETKGTYQLPNGMWAFRAFLVVDGEKKDVKRTKDEFGNYIALLYKINFL